MMTGEVLSYQFDDVIIDLRAGRVLRGGTAVPLEPKAFDLLVLLASRSGELVTRQQVLDDVWAGVYVTDNAVARVVAQLRRVLGDTARGARYIETVPTRGYRFIGPVSRVTASASSPDTAGTVAPSSLAPAQSAPSPQGPETPAPPPPAGPTAHPFWAAGLAALALVAILLAWRSQETARPRVATAVGARTQLTSSAALDAFPAWSPDGRTLAYASDRGGTFEIFLRDMVAGGERLALTADGQHNVQPVWSPDGSQIAYHSSGRGGIWIVARGGGSPRQLSTFGSRPAWSPDGARLAFQSAPYT
jgi:DNA-binding winged helix-turn-helix (wHTH) protein